MGHSLISIDLVWLFGPPSNPRIGNRNWHTISIIFVTRASMRETCGNGLPLRWPMGSDTVSFSSSFGGATRRIFDDWEVGGRQFGVDFSGDFVGDCRPSAVQFIMPAFEARFLAHQEAILFRTGLGFFNFTRPRDERFEVWFHWFDSMLEEANVVFGLGFNQAFQSWMLLSLLQFPYVSWQIC